MQKLKKNARRGGIIIACAGMAKWKGLITPEREDTAMKTRHTIRKKSDEKKARRVGRRGRKREGEEEMDPFALAGKDYLPSMLGDVEHRKRHKNVAKKKRR